MNIRGNKVNLKLNCFFVFIVMLCFSQHCVFSQLTFDESLAKAKSENKRVIVDVYTDWCGWCKKMDKDTYGNSDIKEIVEENFIFVKLNAEGPGKLTYNGREYTEEQLSFYFNIFSFPTTVFLEPDGTLIEFKYGTSKMSNIPGYFKAKDFKKILDFFKDGKYKDSDLSLVI